MNILDFFIHLDHHLNEIISHYGAWTYLILFLIIFCETGLVFTPFLPGDSLLFVVGTFAAQGSLELKVVLPLLLSAAILGNTTNYWIGHFLAPRMFRGEKIPFLKEAYLKRTELYFEKYGGKTIIIAQFAPIIRTCAPFLAGVGSMSYGRFIRYNVTGAVLWIAGFMLAGYFFGNIPFVKRNLTLVIFAIIIISMLPAVREFLAHRGASRKK